MPFSKLYPLTVGVSDGIDSEEDKTALVAILGVCRVASAILVSATLAKLQINNKS